MSRFIPNLKLKSILISKLDSALDKSTEILEDGIKRELSGPQTSIKLGKISGDLQRSIENVKVKKLHNRVLTDIDYAVKNEFGTSKIPARPFFRPGYKKVKDKMAKIFKNTI